MDWIGWPLNRIIILAMGLMFLTIFVQVTLFHYRQNFRHWSMWIPVLATPLFGLLLVLYTFYNADWLLIVLTILLIVGILAGLFGSFMHIRGIGNRVDGYKLRNFLIGPPLTLPSMVTAVSIIGLFALYWE
jgi:hypothetical protein